MAHVMKHTRASCGHMFAHFDRKAEHISNENLDRTRTHLNYNLAVHQQMDQGEFVRQRCSEVRCQNRKDINVMVSWVITAPKDLPEEDYKPFFQASYDFLQKRYGLENVVSSYVHMDEVTPHMHFAFVPVIKAQKRDRKNPKVTERIFKVCAKEAVNRRDLQTFHSDLQKYVEQELGHTVNILNEATRDGNKSIEELKRKSATDRYIESIQQASRIVSEARASAQCEKDSLVGIRAEYEAKRAYIEQVGEMSKASEMYPDSVKVTEKGLMNKQKYVTVPADVWEARHLSVHERIYLNKANEILENHLQEIHSTTSAKRMQSLTQRIKKLEHEKAEIDNERRNLKMELFRAEDTIDQTFRKLNKVLEKLPEPVALQFLEEWESSKKSRTRDFDRGR